MKMLKILLLLILLLIGYLYMQNNLLSVTRLRFRSDRLPPGFDGYRIVHLSDLHDKEFGRNNWMLTAVVKNARPDLIVVTGDLINADTDETDKVTDLMGRLLELAPVYYVTGNHEVANPSFSALERTLREKGIHILRNTADRLERQGDTLLLAGIDDPISTSMTENSFTHSYLEKEIRQVLYKSSPDDFTLLLSHRPENFDLYARYGFDLVFAGHAHGGQLRLPFLGGLVAPNQGLFPRYTAGMYRQGRSVMVVSRGLGASSIPQRIGNRPEVVVITLHRGVK